MTFTIIFPNGNIIVNNLDSSDNSSFKVYTYYPDNNPQSVRKTRCLL